MTYKIPYELEQAISNKKLIIFTGAGISIKEGLPSWKDIVMKVLNDKEPHIEKSTSYSSALDDGILSPLEVLDKIKPHKKHIFDVFDETLNSNKNSSLFIEKLTKITSKFITTNFDRLIEHNAPQLRVITKDSQHNLTKIDSDDSYVLKIHGDVSAIDNCIIFSEQYKTLYTDDNLATFQLKKIFSQHTVLFLGFSFSDHFVTNLFDYISEMLDGFGPSHYIVTNKPLNHKHLNELHIKEHAELDGLIDALLVNSTEPDVTKEITESKTSEEKVFQNDGSDIPPSITSWVGREREIAALNNNFKVYFITALGGQGKSALAAYYLQTMKSTSTYEIFDWRDFKEEDHKFQSKIISMISLAKNEDNSEQHYTGLKDEELIDIFFESLADKAGVFILDNVDSYIDLEEFEPLRGIGLFFNQAVVRNHNSKFIFTCRPFVRFASVDFFQLSLSGLDSDDVVTYFNNSNLSISPDKIRNYAIRAHELTKGHPLWISLIVAQAKRGEKELNKFLDSITRNEIVDDDPSSIMSENILGKIWSSLSDKHKIILRSLAESVQSLTKDNFSEIVSSELTHNRFIRSFKAVKNLGLIIEKAGGEYVELHPLVKEFIKNKFSNNERTKFIYMFIKYYDKVVLILKPKLSNKLSFDDFKNWTNNIELYSNAKEYQKALDSMCEIYEAIKSAGYIEEYLRVASIVMRSLSWDRRTITNFNNFDSVYSNTIETAIEYGDTDLIQLLLSKYESIVENKDPAYIKICEVKAYHAWFNGQYDNTIKICEKASFLLKTAKQPESRTLKHRYALALRDSKTSENLIKSLNIFLSGDELSQVTDISPPDQSKDGSFYGNIARCLQSMGKLNDSINCLAKSFSLLYDTDAGNRFLNLGYAGLWLSEALKQDGKIEVACYFYKFALITWEDISPPLYNKYIRIEMFDHTKSTIQSILSTENWRVESFCSDWVRERLCPPQ